MWFVPRHGDRLIPLLQQAFRALATWQATNLPDKAQRELQRELAEQSQFNVDQRPVIIKTYRGSQTEATKRFQANSAEMAAHGYFPTSQSWVPGQWAVGAFIVAVLLIFLFGLGLLILGYMLIVKPDGALTVTYERRTAIEEKTCPRCAERIKAAALVCHFCGHEFAPGEVKKVEEQVPGRQPDVYRGYTYIIAANGEAELKLSSGAWRKFP